MDVQGEVQRTRVEYVWFLFSEHNYAFGYILYVIVEYLDRNGVDLRVQSHGALVHGIKGWCVEDWYEVLEEFQHPRFFFGESLQGSVCCILD